MARRGKYHDWVTEEGLLKIEGWARDGLTDKQIAEQKIGVNESTLHRWKKTHPQLMQVLKKGKEVVDREVENKLYRNAIGYEYEETKTIIDILPDGSKKQRVEKMKKYAQPDTTAQIFWLRNRKGKAWSNRDLIDADKIKADTEYTKEKTKLLQGEKKDLTHLEELFRVMRDD